MADKEYKIKISIDSKELKNNLSKNTQSVKQFADKSTKSIGSLNIAWGAFLGNVASQALIGGLRAINQSFAENIRLAQVQEDAVNSLNASLAQIGEFSEETSQDLQNYAAQLQSVTRFGDEAIISQLAFAQSMGASAEQSKLIVTAATDMAEALNIDFNSAVRNISKTLGGYAGELGEVIPELKNLTQEQLQAGEGITLLADRYSGRASAALRTFSGQIEATENVIGDVRETLGSFITQTPEFIFVIDEARKLFIDLNKEIKENEGTIRSFISNAVLSLISGFQSLASTSDTLARGFSVLFNTFAFAIDGIQSGILGLRAIWTSAVSEILNQAMKLPEFLQPDSLKEWATTLEESSVQAKESFSNNLDEMKQNAKEVFDGIFGEDIVSEEQIEVFNEKLDQLKENFVNKTKEMKDAQINESKKGNDALKKQEGDFLKALFKQDKEWAKLSGEEKVRNTRDTLATVSQLMRSGNKEQFAIGKAAALATATIDGIQAVQKALASAPPPFNYALAAAVGVVQANNLSRISSQAPPAFQEGGILNSGGTSLTGDNNLARFNDREMFLNMRQQSTLFNAINSGALGGSNLSNDLLAELVDIQRTKNTEFNINGETLNNELNRINERRL